MAVIDSSLGDGTVISVTTGGVPEPNPGSSTPVFFRLPDGVVTLAKQADLAAGRVIGRAAGAGTGTPTALTGAQIAGLFSGDIPKTALAAAVQTSLDAADTALQSPVDTGDLSAAVQALLVLAGTALQSPVALVDLAAAVQASLALADSAAQPPVPYADLAAAVQASLDAADAAIPAVASTDNAVARYNGTGGAVQNSGVTVSDNGSVAWPGALLPPGPRAVAYNAAISLDLAEDNDFTIAALTGSPTITFQNRAAGRAGVIRMSQGGGGGFAPTFSTEGATVTYQQGYDAAGAAIPIAFPSTAAGVICDFHYRFVTATLATIVPMRFG